MGGFGVAAEGRFGGAGRAVGLRADGLRTDGLRTDGLRADGL